MVKDCLNDNLFNNYIFHLKFMEIQQDIILLLNITV